MGWPHGLAGGERMRGSSVSWWSCMSSFRCGTATARGQASLGGSSTRVGRPGRKGPGTPEGVPRTTAMTRHRGHKKSACDEDWALLRLSIPTGQGRVADASATEGIYALRAANASLGRLEKGDGCCGKPPTNSRTRKRHPKGRFGAAERSLIEVYEEQYGDRNRIHRKKPSKSWSQG